jgi:hypothetical protein
MKYICPECGSIGPFQRTQETIHARWQQIDGNGIPQGGVHKGEEEKDDLLCDACDFEGSIHEFESN